MEFSTKLITDLLSVIEKDAKYPILIERIKVLVNTENKFALVNGLEQLIQDCKNKDVPSDRPTLMLIKHIYRQYTS